MTGPGRVQVRAIRGATTVDGNDAAALAERTAELLGAIVERNGLGADDLISALFTVTPDLHADFPARAARALGWTDVPMLCATAVPVPGDLPRCVRVMVHAATPRARGDIAHVYLHGARALRPDLLTG